MLKAKRSENGQALILVAVGLIVLIGFTALAVDGGMVYSDRRHAQNSADATSLAGGGAASINLDSYGVFYENFNCDDFYNGSTSLGAVHNALSLAALTQAAGAGYTLDTNVSDFHGVVAICVDADNPPLIGNYNDEGQAKFNIYNWDVCVGDTISIMNQVTADPGFDLGIDFTFVYEDGETWHLADFNANNPITLIAADATGGVDNDGEYRIHIYETASGTTTDHMTFRVDNCAANDMDGDGISDENDSDMDGDGIINENDDDMDGDGIDNEDDDDMDGDGIDNEDDDDMDGDGVDNDEDDDMDGDGIDDEDDDDIDGDGVDNEYDDDDDGDGLDDDHDEDDDSDGINDSVEIALSAGDKYIDIITFITKDTDTSLLHFVYSGPARNRVEAVVRVRPRRPLVYGNAIVALNPAACQGNQNGAVFHGTAAVTVSGGGVFSNGCLRGTGTPTVDASLGGSISYAGDFSGSAGIFTPSPQAVAGQIPESMYTVPAPDCAHANANNVSGSAINGNLAPGLYCVTGDVQLNGGDTLMGSDVTLYLQDGRLRINGNATVQLSAPSASSNTDPAVPGMLIYAPASNGNEIQINGNSSSYFTGTILAPGADINMLGTGAVEAYQTQVIGWNVEVGGTADTDVVYQPQIQYHSPPSLDLVK